MIGPQPDFMKWVEVDQDGWHLKPGAPDNIKKEFDAYMKETNITQE